MRYELEYDLETIQMERLYVGEELVLERGEEGKGSSNMNPLRVPSSWNLRFLMISWPVMPNGTGFNILSSRLSMAGPSVCAGLILVVTLENRYALKSSFEAKRWTGALPTIPWYQ